MAQKLIIVGTPNSREGDSLFAAFTKINENFTVIYTALGLDSDTTLNLGDFEFTSSTMTNTNDSTIVIGKASTNVVVVGETSQTTTVESQIEIAATGIVIAKRLIETNDDGVVTATDNLGSILELNNSSASIKKYADPAGPDNSLYSQFTTSGGAVIETVFEDVGSTSYGRVNAGAGDVVITTSDGATVSAWQFGTGALVYPNSALQRDTATVSCPGTASTVVYTVSGQYQHTIKLLIQVEGSAPGDPYDTQACEMIIAKSFRANALAASVYGVVHTSVAPLATFTANWNALTSRVEVVCTTPNANTVNVKIFATEITTSD